MFVSIFSSSYSNRASGCIPPKCQNILLTSLFFLTSFLFPSLWNSHLTVAWGERGWHSRKVLLPSTPNCTVSLRRFSTAPKETREMVTAAKESQFNFKGAKHKKVAWPLALKPLHCLSGSPCLTSCLLLLLRKRSELRIKCTSSLVWRCWEDKRPLWPLCGRGEGGAALSIPGAVGVSSQTAVGAGPAVHAAAVQRHLGQPRVWWHVQLLLWWRKQNKVSSVWLWGICCASDLCLRWICLLF